MSRSLCLLVVASLLLGCQARNEGPQDRTATRAQNQIRDGVYVVLRDGIHEQDVLPLADGEALVLNHRYLKQEPGEATRYVVLRASPDVLLDLAGAPESVVEGGEVVRILLKLRPEAAAALERLTSDPQSRQVAIVLGGEVVTTHKVREAIRGGEVQITSCAPGGAAYLLDQLRAHAAPSR
jgi:preprotein translocase subunit SecD